MKYLLFFIVSTLAVAITSGQRFGELTSEAQEKLGTFIDTCLSTYKINRDTYNNLIDGQHNADPCFFECVFGGVGAIKGGKMDETFARQFDPYMGEDEVNRILNACRKFDGEDKCETYQKIYECWRDNGAGFL